MRMKRIEAPTLEEAYKLAAKEFDCSVTEISYEIVQHPSTGMMGLFKKSAIIIAAKKTSVVVAELEREGESKHSTEPSSTPSLPDREEDQVASEKVNDEPKSNKMDLLDKQLVSHEDKVLDSFFDANKTTQEHQVVESEEENFSTFDDDRELPENKKRALEIEEKLTKLMAKGCFAIDTVEVDVFNNTAHIFIDGDDAALLIGKEGYRYNALSYMLFNWINAHYDLYIKLEIAEFIQAQREMIINYLKPIIANVKERGRGKTKPLDGILVQIALEQLRESFPNKYVAIKTGKDNRKFIIINNFNTKKDG